MGNVLDTGYGSPSTLQVVRPVAGRPADDGRTGPVKMTLGGSFGKLVIPYAPQEAALTGLAPDWQEISRPGIAPLLERAGETLPQVALEFTIAARGQVIEGTLYALRALALRNELIVVGGYTIVIDGLWRIVELSINPNRFEPTKNLAIRASVAMTLKRASDGSIGSGPAAGGHVSATLAIPAQATATGAVQPATSTWGSRLDEQVRAKVVELSGQVDDFVKIAIAEGLPPGGWKQLADQNGVVDPKVKPATVKVTRPAGMSDAGWAWYQRRIKDGTLKP